MPSDYIYNKNDRVWVQEEKERKIEYDDSDIFDPDSWGLLISYWRACPDRLLDLMEADNPTYSVGIIQRLCIRAYCSFVHVFITGSRGLTKSFTSLTAKLLMGVLYPGIIMRYYGPSQKQMAEIASEKWEAIKQQWPGLASHWEVVSNAQERFEVKTKYGSVLSITIVRGNDCNGITGEEVAQSEAGKAFDFKEFAEAVLPTARVARKINKENDPFFPNYQKQYITSAGNQQGEAYQYRRDTFNEMIDSDTAFCVDLPYSVPVLSGIRDADYYIDLRSKMTPEAQLREIDSIWTGSSENPVIRDCVLTESKILPIMENRHCGDPNAIYVLGYDVSYADGANNAKCATSVLKCEFQSEAAKKDRFLKSFVYITDNPPPRDQFLQARQLKDRWYRFYMEGGRGTYIAIDAWQYGKSIVETLHRDLGDGLPPLCCINHEFPELEQPGALPVIYAIKATAGYGGGDHDPDIEMIRYAELEWEHRNVRLLISNIYDGVRAYKLMHHIKDDEADPSIAIPYLKTKEMCGQIANLQKKATGETRISKSIQRDMWSSCKYALRLAQILEREEQINGARTVSPWQEFFSKQNESGNMFQIPKTGNGLVSRIIGRRGGNNR